MSNTITLKVEKVQEALDLILAAQRAIDSHVANRPDYVNDTNNQRKLSDDKFLTEKWIGLQKAAQIIGGHDE